MRLKELLTESRMEQVKVSAHKKRLYFDLDRLKRDMKSSIAMKETDIETLKEYFGKMDDMLSERAKKKENIRNYAERGKESIYEIADKSLAFFKKKLVEEVCDNIESYRGTDFKDYVEQNMPRLVKRNLETWCGVYSAHLDEALSALERELARGLSYYFNQQVKLIAEGIGGLKSNKTIFSVEAEDISNVNLKAGAIVAAGSLGLLALVGGAVMPLISLAALPFLRDKMLKERLAAAKAEVLPTAKTQVVKAVTLLGQEVHKYIDTRIENIISNAEYAYEHILLDMRKKIEAEIKLKQESKSEAENEIRSLSKGTEEIEGFIRKINKGEELK